MNLTDVIALARAGYKKKDIDELLAIEVEEPEEPQEKVEEKEEPEETEEEEEPAVDYKKLYEESQEQLKAAQKKNVKEPMKDDSKKDEDVVADLIKNFRS